MMKSVTAKYIFFDDGNRIPVKGNRPILEAQYEECIKNMQFYQRMIAEISEVRKEKRDNLDKMHVTTKDECMEYFKKHGRDAVYLDMTWSIASDNLEYTKKSSEISGMTQIVMNAHEKFSRNCELARQIKGVLNNARSMAS